ncbi:ArsR family transcriptional regulator [Alphaproteobacteria bacterium]|jgi:DNA-binding transcriptional ArsR family regulator|nr:ArsR family transcriptional regulator [Alphaproteobacteria bacterium]
MTNCKTQQLDLGINEIEAISHGLACKFRLEILTLLFSVKKEGLTVGEIKLALGIPGSSLTYHLNHLKACALIAQTPEGREIRCFLNGSTLRRYRVMLGKALI